MIGFRWLVHSDNHWNFVEPVNLAEVVSRSGTRASLTTARISRFFRTRRPWSNTSRANFTGGSSRAKRSGPIDYVAAPLMLSQETTQNEMNWSVGTYMTNAEVEKAFGVSDLPKPWAVAPNQPFTGGFISHGGFALLACCSSSRFL